MSIRLITECDGITINEELTDNETIYEYVSRVIEQFEDKNNVRIIMVITTTEFKLSIRLK